MGVTTAERPRRITSEEARKGMRPIEGDTSRNAVDILRDTLKSRIFGQDEACQSVASRVAISEAGLGEKNKPLGVFFFLGPTGTGKTEMSHALSEKLFGDPNSPRLKIVPMEEYQDSYNKSRLLGAPPGYVGYDDDPFISHEWLNNGEKSVVVFDEIEKAHPDIVKMLLGVLNDATLNATSDEGTKALDFSNSYIIFTSNAGAEKMQGIQEATDIKNIGLEALKASFPPEFRGRINDPVVFLPLGQDNLLRIADKFIQARSEYWKERNPTKAPEEFDITEDLQNYLLAHVDPSIGARGVKNVLDTQLFPVAAAELAGLPLADTKVVADYAADGDNDGRIVFLIPEGEELQESNASDAKERNLTDPMIERAKEVLGKDFLGVEAIRHLEQKLAAGGVDVTFDLRNIPTIPYTERDIETAKANEEMLVLRAKRMTVNGKETPITLTAFEKLFTKDPLENEETIFLAPAKDSENPDSNGWYQNESFATDPDEIEYEWAFVKKYPLLGTEGRSWDEQEKMLKIDYKYYLRGKGAKHSVARRRTAIRTTWDTMLYYVNTGERLLDDAFDWGSTVTSRDDETHVFAGFVYNRFGIGSAESDAHNNVNGAFPKGVYPER